MVIATKSVTAHLATMAASPKNEIPEDVLAQMRPERIGYRLGLLREAHNLKPSEMADMLGIERTYWSRFENGRRAITEKHAALLVHKFGVTMDFLILGKWDRLPLELAERMRKVERSKS